MSNWNKHRTFSTPAKQGIKQHREVTMGAGVGKVQLTTKDWKKRVYDAVVVDKKKTMIKSTKIATWNGQDLNGHSTSWEKRWALPLGHKNCVPVVLSTNLLIGHIRPVRGDHLWVDKQAYDGESWKTITDDNIAIVLNNDGDNQRLADMGLMMLGGDQNYYTTFFDENGYVIRLLEIRTDGNVEESLLQADDLIGILSGAWMVKKILQELIERKIANKLFAKFRWKQAQPKPKTGKTAKVKTKIKGGGKFVELTPAEMETFLRDLWENVPLLKRIQKAHKLSGEALHRELKAILKEFERTTGKKVEWVKTGAVQNATRKGNYASLRSKTGVLQIENKMLQLKEVRQFLAEVRHELCAHYAGVPAKVVQMGDQHAMDILEMAVKNDFEQVMKLLFD